MNFEKYESCSAHNVKKLFTDVFSGSEGQAEGELIGNLVFELQETTEPKDMFSYLVTKASEFKKTNKLLINKDKCVLKEYNIG